jgi:antitoxin ParD1/3/4
MRPISIELPDDLREFLEREVEAGGYESASEYVQSLLKGIRQSPRREHVDQLLREGLASGPAEPFTAGDWDWIRQQANID